MAREQEVAEAPAKLAATTEEFYATLAVANQVGKDMGAGEKITFNQDNFDQIGPKAKEVLTAAGVKEISFTPGADGVSKIEATLDKKFEIAQDPEKDGCNKLIVGPKLSADFKKGPSGELMLENIKGLQADTNLGIANVIRIKMSRDDAGNTEIESTGKKGIFSRTKVRTKPGEIMDKAESILNRLEEIKSDKAHSNKTGYLNVPPLFKTA